MVQTGSSLTIGPLLFHWSAEKRRDFYFRIADEAPVDTVYLGEAVCAKREPFFDPLQEGVVERLTRGGKRVLLSTLAQVMTPIERKSIARAAAQETLQVEANDASALQALRGRPHAVGPFVNVYNERTLALLADHGAVHVTLPSELPQGPIKSLGKAARKRSVTLEVQVYGRIPLALSARCYHARAHGRVKDNCQFVCEIDPDGRDLQTLDRMPFLAINGVQTLSHQFLNLVQELDALKKAGVSAFRLSPHDRDMVEIAQIFRDVVDGVSDPVEALAKMDVANASPPFANGFFHGVEGYRWVQP